MSVTGIICEYDPLHTGHAWLMARARAAGMNAHMSKPMEIELLVKTLKEWL